MSDTKAYPLSVSWLGSDSDWFKFISKGHHDFKAFMDQARGEDEHDAAMVKFIAHDWLRVVPDATGEYPSFYHPAKPGARGAFPVTIASKHELENGVSING